MTLGSPLCRSGRGTADPAAEHLGILVPVDPAAK